MSVSVGSVSPSFDVDAVVVETRRPEYLELRAEGSSSQNAFDATATMSIEESDGPSEVAWTAEASVSGLIASLGQRALGNVTNKLANDFYGNMEAAIRDESVTPNCRLRAVDEEAEAGG